MGAFFVPLVLAAFAIVVSCETTTPTPLTTTTTETVEMALQTGICRQCICKDDNVNCSDQNITTFFQKDDWAALKPLKPTHVDLSENLFRNVTVMAELPIQVLNLSHCNIEQIERASFRDLQEMRVLDLSHNRLTAAKLSPHAFEGRYSPEEYEPLSQMRKLNLAHNDLHSLNQDLFEHLPELQELDLSGNPFTTIDHVTVVAISSLPMLKVLRMRSCQIQDIPDKFLHTPLYLERLDLSDNQLSAVPQELDETKNLLYLNLNQNPIVKLDMTSEDYRGFPRLRKLIELHMCNMPVLTSIGVGALAGLEALHLLTGGFPRLRKLIELHMCNMPVLTSIGVGALAGLEVLQKLHLSFNPRLSYLDPKALARPDDIGENYDWPVVRELYLQSNNLTEVDSRFLSRWDLLEKLDVSDNPYLCDCSTQWMVDILVPIVDSKSGNSSKMVCQEPIEMRGYTFEDLHMRHRKMRCLDMYGHRPERDGSILLGTFIGVLLAVPIVMSLMLMWRRGYFGWLGLRAPVDVSRAFYKRAPADDNYI